MLTLRKLVMYRKRESFLQSEPTSVNKTVMNVIEAKELCHDPSKSKSVRRDTGVREQI